MFRHSATPLWHQGLGSVLSFCPRSSVKHDSRQQLLLLADGFASAPTHPIHLRTRPSVCRSAIQEHTACAADVKDVRALASSDSYLSTTHRSPTHARTHARTHAHTHACTHGHTHACTHARTHLSQRCVSAAQSSWQRMSSDACSLLSPRACRTCVCACARARVCMRVRVRASTWLS